MKTLFSSFYPPTNDEFSDLWAKATFVLDTNVLLDLYRLPSSAQNDFFSVLEKIRDRIWIPHQAGLEYERNRTTVIAAEKKKTNDAVTKINDIISLSKNIATDLDLEKRNLGFDVSPLLKSVDQSVNALLQALQKTHDNQLDICSTDPVRERLNQIFENKVGSGPSNQEELNSIIADGEDRYNNRIPPGYEDAQKDKNPNNSFFYFKNIRYERKFGDLIFWRQIIKYAQETKIKNIIIVSGEKKEHWWWRENGKMLGARPELVQELKQLSDVDTFWLCSSAQFVANANTFLSTQASPKTLKELENVSTLPPDALEEKILEENAFDESLKARKRKLLIRSQIKDDEKHSLVAVYSWVKNRYGSANLTDNFPTITYGPPWRKSGVEIVTLRDLGLDRFFSLLKIASKGSGIVKSGNLYDFTIVLIIVEAAVKSNKDIEKFLQRLIIALQMHSIKSILLGTVIDSSFKLLQTIRITPDSIEEGD